MYIGNWAIATHSEFVPNNIHDQIAQRKRCGLEKRELERQRKSMEIQETQRKWAEGLVNPGEKAQRQEFNSFSYNEQKLREKMILRQREEDFRALSLETAKCVYGKAQVIGGNVLCPDIKSMAQSFYTYITNGE